jgi:hypothetical protein
MPLKLHTTMKDCHSEDLVFVYETLKKETPNNLTNNKKKLDCNRAAYVVQYSIIECSMEQIIVTKDLHEVGA